MKKIRVAVVALLMLTILGGAVQPVSAGRITHCPRHMAPLIRHNATGICIRTTSCRAAVVDRYACPMGDYSYKLCSMGHEQ